MVETHPLSHLYHWLGHEDRRAHLSRLLNEHFLSVYQAYGVALEDIERVVGRDWMMTLLSWVLEDFLSQPLDPDRPGMVDDYLERWGWKDSTAMRCYIEAVRKSHMSLYEVTDMLPGRFLEVRDL